MALRFRKVFSLLPGVRLNLGKKGLSVSLGGNGITANISKHGVRKTVSVPGTGLAYSNYQKYSDGENRENKIRPAVLYGVIISILAIAGGVILLLITLSRGSSP